MARLQIIPLVAVAAIVLSAAGSALLSQTNEPARTPKSDVEKDLRCRDLLTRLGSPDYATRQQAQKYLEKIPSQQLADIVERAESQPDPEVKSRLEARIAEIQEAIAVDPPPLSIHVKTGMLYESIKALNKSMNTNIKYTPRYELIARDTLFSLDVDQKSFWDIFLDLSNQHPLGLSPSQGFDITDGTTGLHTCDRHGGFAFFPVKVVRSVELQAPPPQQTQLALNYLVAADPRIKILRNSLPQLTEVIDNTGANLLKNKPGEPRLGWFPNRWCWEASESLNLPGPKATKIVSAKGRMAFVVEVAHGQTQPCDLATLTTPIILGGQRVTITNFKVEKDKRDFSFGAMQDVITPGFGGDDKLPVTVILKVTDATGAQVWSDELTTNLGASVGAEKLVLPLKLQVIGPTRTREITILFASKDIPLP